MDNSSKAQAEALQTTMTPSVLISETPTPTIQHELDVTFGIVLAGNLINGGHPLWHTACDSRAAKTATSALIKSIE